MKTNLIDKCAKTGKTIFFHKRTWKKADYERATKIISTGDVIIDFAREASQGITQLPAYLDAYNDKGLYVSTATVCDENEIRFTLAYKDASNCYGEKLVCDLIFYHRTELEGRPHFAIKPYPKQTPLKG